MQQIFTKEYALTTNFYDKDGYLNMQGVMDLFQNAAAWHAALLGASGNELLVKGLFWVIARTEVAFKTFIKTPLNVKVVTWPLKPTRFYFDRMYQIINTETNEVIANGRSRWLLLDIVTRKISVNAFVYPLASYYESNLFSADSPRFNEATTFRATYIVRPSDIDENGHLNNSRYGNIIYDTLNLAHNEVIESFTINYINEALVNDEITLFCNKNGREIVVTGRKGDTIIFGSKVVINYVR